MKRRTFLAGTAATGATMATGLSVPAFAAGTKPVKVGFIGSMSSDVGKSTLRGGQIAIDELNAAGGALGGREIKMVTADTNGDVTEGIKAYEYLCDGENVDFVLSGSVDDVSLGWLPRMVEYRKPTLDTWTSSTSIIDKLVKEYDKYKTYFMNVACDVPLATLYVDFGKDVLAKKMGWKTVVLLQEDTDFGRSINGLVTQMLAPEAGIKVVDTITYDVGTVDFSPMFSRCVESKADFIYIISSVNSQIISSQYVKLQVPMAMTGVNVAALGEEYWSDTGGQGGGISSLSPVPSVGFDLDPTSQAFVDKYVKKYGDSRPKFPHFNGFNAYYGLKQAFAAAEQAGGFNDSTWVTAMENQDLILKRNGELWLRYAFWKPGEVEPRTKRTYPHNIRFDITPPYNDGAPAMVVIQWYEDGTPHVVYPPKYANGEFKIPSWVPKQKT